MSARDPADVTGDSFIRSDLPDGRSGFLNTLSLEEYLYGVVPVEMPSSWPYAALEAQAIVARTFAMKRRNPNRVYDLIAGSADQEYHGLDGEAAAANAAIDACAGLIVLYNGAPANIAYMSCCGGYTDDAGRVWGTSYPYLGGVACPYCADAPNRNWSVRVGWSAVANAAGLESSAVPQSLVPDELNGGGRPGALRIQTTDGQVGRITTSRLREVSGWRLPSTFVRSVAIEQADGRARWRRGLRPAPDDGGDLDDRPNAQRRTGPNKSTLVIQGSGSGHGIGLCQWGARGMAAAGATGQEIVAHYFPTTILGAANRIIRPGDLPYS